LIATESCGIIFAATGDGYVNLAERAANSVRQHCPDFQIDLFTDSNRTLPIFDRVIHLDNPWHRSKLDALLQSRFDRSLYLDADLILLADVSDVFEVLDRFDIAMAHDQGRNSAFCNAFWQRRLPNAFPQFNSGVIAFRKTSNVISFINLWRDSVKDCNVKSDQLILRELIWDSPLRVATLPEEYNLMHFNTVLRWTPVRAAPRIIHHPLFHKSFSSNHKRQYQTVADLVGPFIAARIPDLIDADRQLAFMKRVEPVRRTTWRRIRYYGRTVSYLFSYIIRKLKIGNRR
jgi:hypothetical protein